MDKEKSEWMEERVNAIMETVEHRPEIMPAIKDYIDLVSHSAEVIRETRQKALLKPVTFAHDLLVNLVSCIAFDEYDFGKDKLQEHELLERINEDLAVEIQIIVEGERGPEGRAH